MLQTKFVSSLRSVDAERWDALWQSSYPFTQHAFLLALEDTGCVGDGTGWQPMHLVAYEQAELIAVMPLFVKGHSYGEYVFDWSWADAYHRNGLNYYPKLVNAAPFTPATGPRWAIDSRSKQPEVVLTTMLDAVAEKQTALGASGFHCLFPNAANVEQLPHSWHDRLQTRYGCQYHWFNDGFDQFDDFLGQFNARKRKSLKRERRRVQEQALTVDTLHGRALTTADWQGFYHLYQTTYLKRSGHTGYLNEGFFQRLGDVLAAHVAMVKAFHNGQWVAAALYFFDENTLYGRYWGALAEFDGLHFECCYYSGIEFAIRQGLQRFDPGAQGEHKVQRGFTPILTQSLHSLAHPQFDAAIGPFLAEESKYVHSYCLELRAQLPFRKEVTLPSLTRLVDVTNQTLS